MINVMIVDDQEILCIAIKQMIEKSTEIKVSSICSNGLEALDKCKTLEPDLILMDISMPVMDGIQATKAIKTFNTNIIILILSTSNNKDNLEEALNAGADHYIFKNAPSDDFIFTIKNMYNKFSNKNKPVEASKNKIENSFVDPKQLFFSDFPNKLNFAFKSLLSYCLNKDIISLQNIRRFFHIMNGTGAMLELHEISKIGSNYEDLLERLILTNKLISDDYFNILKAMSQLNELNNNIISSIDNSTSNANYIKESNIIASVYKSQSPLYTDNTFSQLTVLIVDDDIVLLNILEQKLRLDNINVFVAGDYNQALDILDKKSIDIVLLDVLLPGLDGFALIDTIKKSQADIYVIFMSSKNEAEYKIKAFSKDANDYIVKPFDLDELLARIGVGKKQIQSKNTLILHDSETGLSNKAALEKSINSPNDYSGNIETLSLVLFSFKNVEHNYRKNPQLFFEKTILPFTTLIKNKYPDTGFRIGEFEFVLLFKNLHTDFICEQLSTLFGSIEKENITTLCSFSFSISEIPKEKADLKIILDKLFNNLTKYSINKPFDISENLHKPRILIIDDDDIIIRLIKTRLQSRNFEIIHAYDGEKGLQSAIDFRPDIILLDLMLPLMDGFEVTQKIRANLSFENTKIIMLSAKKQEDIISKALETGVDDFIVKPFSLLEIEVRINKILKEFYD